MKTLGIFRIFLTPQLQSPEASTVFPHPLHPLPNQCLPEAPVTWPVHQRTCPATRPLPPALGGLRGAGFAYTPVRSGGASAPGGGDTLGSGPTNFFGTLRRPSGVARRRLPAPRLAGRAGAGALTAVAAVLAAKAAEAGAAFSERRAGTFPRRRRLRGRGRGPRRALQGN